MPMIVFLMWMKIVFGKFSLKNTLEYFNNILYWYELDKIKQLNVVKSKYIKQLNIIPGSHELNRKRSILYALMWDRILTTVIYCNVIKL